MIHQQFNLVTDLKLSEDSTPENVRFRMRARTTQPVQYGNIIHNFSGMNVKDKITVDMEHNPDRIAGYADKFNIEDNALYIEGEFTPFRKDDFVSEMITKMAKGVPYEASVHTIATMDDITEYRSGDSFVVNNTQFEGPAIVINKFTLRAVAVTPRGADADTSTILLLTEDYKEHLHELFKEVNTMSKEQVEEKVDSVEETELVESEEVEKDEEKIEQTVEETALVEDEPEDIKEDKSKEELMSLIQMLTEKIESINDKLTKSLERGISGGTPTKFSEAEEVKTKKSIFKRGPFSN